MLRFAVLTAAVVFFSCAGTSRPLASRGLGAEERRHYVIQSGYGMSEAIRESFLSGLPMVGMTKEMVFQLYGAPDRTVEGDTIWEYVNNKGKLVTGFRFEENEVAEIMGDPRGGLPVGSEAE